MADITQEDLEHRLSAAVVRQIFDDDSDGTADEDPVARLLADAISEFYDWLTPVYGAPPWPTVPEGAKRLQLDFAVAYAAMRHPEYVRRDAKALLEHVHNQIKLHREGLKSFGIATAPEPAANQGGFVWDGGPDTSEPPKTFFLPGANGCGGMGDF